MNGKDEKKWDALVANLSKRFSNVKSYKEIERSIKSMLKPKYGSGPKVIAVAEDLAESVALKLGIPQD